MNRAVIVSWTAVLLPVAIDERGAEDPADGATRLPGLRKLADIPLRDASMCRAPDGT